MDMVEGVTAELAFTSALRSLSNEIARLRPVERIARLAGVQQLAAAQGLAAATELTAALRVALTREPKATPVATWLDAIAEAARARAGAAAAPVYLATIGCRLDG